MSQSNNHPRPLSLSERSALLQKFQRMILEASNEERNFSLRFKRATYSATLTSWGRCIVRDARGNDIASSGYGWLDEATK